MEVGLMGVTLAREKERKIGAMMGKR